ncbi:TetR family transcriptional regulator [Mycolicibacterium phlei RIVM601174]|jgi:hypothetical protein|nr:TetR family transcriptional regulator [Mycolicibacterium phlei RIVM601174]MBF4191581.1 TetR family transcriptional regulator [Mycolicibacterium phlei]
MHPHPGGLHHELRTDQTNPTLEPGGLKIGDSPAAFVRGLTEVLESTEQCWASKEPFLERLVQASLVGNDAARRSPTLRAFIEGDEAGHTYKAVEPPALWQETLIAALGQRLAEAAVAGEIRDDVPPATLARWIARVNFTLMTEPGNPEDGGDEGILRTFLVASLKPRGR